MTPFDIADMPRRDAEQFGKLRLREGVRCPESGEVHDVSSQIARNDASPDPRNYVVEAERRTTQNARMPRKSSKQSANHLRAWREAAKLTQDQLAELVGTQGNVIGLLESGERRLSEKWLRKLAPHLKTTPGFLLDHHPGDIEAVYMERAIQARKKNPKRAEAIIFALASGTEDE